MTHIEIKGHRVGLLRQGSGEPVVLLHSHGASSAQWRSLIEVLSPHFLVLAPDLYGHGGTAPWPGPSDFSFADEAALVLGLLDTLGEPAHLVGHSYGAATALHLARARRAALRSLTLIEPAAFHLLRDGDAEDRLGLEEFLAATQAMKRAVDAGDPVGAFGVFVDYWNGRSGWNDLPAHKRAALAAALPAVTLAFGPTTADPARIADFRSTVLPTLLVQGTRSRLPATRTCRRLALAWPHARVELIALAGHMAPLSHAAEVNALVRAHLLAHARPRDATAFA